MEGIILAGGFGTRLRPRVSDVPKPMAAVAGRPFLYWLLDRLVQADFRRIVLSVGYGKTAIREALGSCYRNIELVYAEEDSPLGTGGAIRHAMTHLNPGSHAVWVMNGDTVSALDHRKMYMMHAAGSAPITMALVRVPDASRYGAVAISDNRVTGFAGGGKAGPGVINSGTYLLNRELFAGSTWPKAFSFEHDFLPPMIHSVDIRVFEIKGWFLDIGIPEDFDRAQLEIPAEFAHLS
jgi:D-glycero-alpha-D-manno-heptose 1-phosphate guanylyltransferase